MNKQTKPLLRRALLGNAAFSTISGCALLALGGVLEEPFGVPAIALRVVGLVLLPFAFGLWRNARQENISIGEAWLAVVLDIGWVVGSAALILGNLWPLKPVGSMTVILVALVVALCATLQWLGIRQKESLAPGTSS